jgi:septal ring factor EnvC (AmiA/AmiB activator)
MNKIKRGESINIPVDIEIITDKEAYYIELIYKLEKMYSVANSKYVCCLYEPTLGSIPLDFEQLRLQVGTKIRKEIERYMISVNEIMKEIENYEERYYRTSEKLNKTEMELTREELAHDKTKKDLNETRNALVVANNEIVELKQTINDMKKDNQEDRMLDNKIGSLNLMKTVLPFLVKNIINMSKKGKTEMEILKKAEDYIERLKNVK